MEPILINGLPLPSELISLIESGRWKRPSVVTALVRLTDVKRADNLSFLSMDSMKRETAALHQLEADPRYAGIYGLASSRRLGHAVADRNVLDVDSAVVIAVNADEDAIFLDYRCGNETPCVVMTWYLEGQSNTQYRRIATDISDFIKQAGLLGSTVPR